MTEPDPVVERVARAIHDRPGRGKVSAWDVQTEAYREGYRGLACAAVAAMGDTTPEPDGDQSLSDFAEQYLYDGENDRPLPGYNELLDLAAARSGGTR